MAEGKATLTIWDDGKHFPPDTVEKPAIDAPLGDREIGGLGIYLVNEMMDRVDYKRDENDTNVMVLEKVLRTK
jgi:anti-sigma regulatory factor (Ser/Thr protein kinase)